jgi:hypothetical protein
LALAAVDPHREGVEPVKEDSREGRVDKLMKTVAEVSMKASDDAK